MDELEHLMTVLQSLPDSEWVVSARTALADPTIRFEGRRHSASVPVRDVRRIYEIRFAHQKKRGKVASGMAEFVSELGAAGDAERVRIVPFLGEAYVVGAFYNSAGRLIGCISGPYDTSGGQDGFALAAGPVG